MRSIDPSDRSSRSDWGLLLLAFLVFIAFILQLQYLHLAAASRSDEIEHVGAGLLISSGLIPYRDFLYHQFPGVPFILAIGWKIFDQVFHLRILYLIVNCLSVLLLYVVIKKISARSYAAILSTICYLTYHELVHHDFRLIAIRQFSNILLILYLYLAIVHKRSIFNTILLALSASLNILIFVPSCLAIAAISLATIYLDTQKQGCKVQLYSFIRAGLATLATMAVLCVFIPETLGQTIFHVLTLPPRPRMDRLFSIYAIDSIDFIFHFFGTFGLIVAFFALRSQRALIAAIAVLIVSPLIPSGFFMPHYIVVAGPAFSLGIAYLFICTERIKSSIYPFACKILRLCVFTLLCVVIGWHLKLSIPSLLSEWSHNRGLGFRAVVTALRQSPEPILTFFEGMYLIEAGKRQVNYYEQVNLRYLWFMGKKPEAIWFQDLADKSCSILVTYWDRQYIPIQVYDDWVKHYKLYNLANSTQLFVTNNSFCQINRD